MARKEIIFSAKDTGVADVMQKLRQSANELGRELAQDARNYTTSGKEAVKYIEEQIKAMERRNKLSKEQSKFVLDSQRAQQLDGANSIQREKVDKKYNEAVTDLNLGSREDDMQLSLLRELIETVKTNAREEIAADRKNVTTQLASDKRLNQLGIEDDEDEFESLKRTIQREEIGTVAGEEEKEKDKFDAARTGKRISDESASALSRPNEIYAVAGMMALIPIVGDGLAMLANKALGEAEARQDSQAKAQGQAGGIGVSLTGYQHGLNTAEATSMFGSSQTSGSARALGMRGFMNDKNMSSSLNLGAQAAMNLQMSRGIDAGSLNQLGGFLGYNTQNLSSGATSERKGSAGGTAFDVLAKSFSHTGLLGSSGNMTQNMPAIMSQMTGVLGTLTNTLSNVKYGDVAVGMANLTKLGGSFADPEKVGDRYQQLHGGLTDTSNPYAQAAKFWTLQGLPGNSGKSRFELMQTQEKGMTEPGFMRSYMEKLQTMSGGNLNNFKEMVKAAFPQLSFNQAGDLAEGFKKDPNTFDVDFEKAMKNTPDITTPGHAGLLAQETAKWSDAFADVGEKMITAASLVEKAIKELISYL